MSKTLIRNLNIKYINFIFYTIIKSDVLKFKLRIMSRRFSGWGLFGQKPVKKT